MVVWMSGIADVFTELLFGSGGIFGFIIIFVLLISMTLSTKIGGLFASVVAFVLGILYIDNLAVNSNLWWFAILTFLSIPFFLINFAVQAKKEGF
jgi:hypothetical protein